MTSTEQTHQCEIELELSKHDFREDIFQLGHKLHEARIRLSPAHIMREKPFLTPALGALVGLYLGY
jgi:hypothetical protein